MDSGQSPPQKPPPHLSPRRELQLQGPRPSPLRVSKDSHKIKKPPFPPPPAQSFDSREPVIIYTISPKVIHVEPSNFMDLVQRLTGPDIAGPESPPSDLHSPAAKLASLNRTVVPVASPSAVGLDVMDDLGVDLSASFPGILSPVPAALPPISPAFFSPSYQDSSFQNWGSFGNFYSPSFVSSPGPAAWDLFNQFQDF